MDSSASRRTGAPSPSVAPSPKKFRSSLVPMSKPSPGRPLHSSSKFVPSPGPVRDLFATTPKPSRITQFAPNLPTGAKELLPNARKIAAPKHATAGMASNSSNEHFIMKISEPDSAFSGEALAKAIPQALSRKGVTVYADQYLAEKCPPDFTDEQRRQFFCILDLRRLKYSADEIFVKKAWNLNMKAFAKEYEKSRGLILLRYGLYEFKNVKPSKEVLKSWRQKHNLPEPELEDETKASSATARSAAKSTGSTKRKADDDLPQPSDNTLKASGANANKRRNVEQEQDATETVAKFAPTPMKSKRKADQTEEPDENLPAKFSKSTPSAAKSKLESIINNVQSGASTPKASADWAESLGMTEANYLRPPSNGVVDKKRSRLDSPQFHAGATLNGGIGGSVLSGHKVGSAPTTGSSNIFGHLSESSAQSSGNEQPDADESEDEADEPNSEHESDQESGSQGVPHSAVASTGTSTPPIPSVFSSGKAATTSNPFASAFKSTQKPATDKPASTPSRGGLFDRMSYGADGQPLRATPTPETAPITQAPTKSDVPEPPKARAPARDFTFNPETTPIKFGAPSGSVLSATPDASVSGTTASTHSATEPAEVKPLPASKGQFPFFNGKPSETPKNETAQTPASLFAAKPTVSSSFIFGNPPANSGASNLDTSEVGQKPLFSFDSAKPVAPASSVFGSSQTRKIAPDSDQDTASGMSAPKDEPKSIFGSQPARSTGPFANAAITPSTATIFGNAKTSGPAQTTTNGGQPLFASGGNAASSVFGTASETPATTSTEISSQKRDRNDLEHEQPPKRAFFGASQSEDHKADKENKNPLFGIPKSAESATPAEAKTPFTSGQKSLFGSSTPAPATSIFGNLSSPAPVIQFGGQSNMDKDAAKMPVDQTAAKPSGLGSSITNPSGPIFSFGNQAGGESAKSTRAPASTIFGSDQATNAGPIFGGAATQGNGPSPASFQFGGGNDAGNSSSPFTFGGTQNPASSAAPGSFTFTSSFPNPFASGAATVPATPSLGAASATPTPSGSFIFQSAGQAQSSNGAEQTKPVFGGQSNGNTSAPSFSFTAATPPQNSPNPSAPSKANGLFSGVLNSGNAVFNGADSPFPAPSSINTTPVNGSPELQPQTQAEEGVHEAPQEQLSLTDDGPGEEDEVTLHEVRAKAIKYVPVNPGDDEEDAQKSPWRTQGVGALRLRKSKATGTVRLLLRAEPRGHVAMNKTILAETQYKADGKTVKIMAASDDGSRLETWMIQVKKPEAAIALAAALEAHKGANKK